MWILSCFHGCCFTFFLISLTLMEFEEPFPFDLNTVLGKLKIPAADVLNAYVIGSRLWGTATSQSDFDLVVVAASWPPSKPQTVHNGMFDAKVLSLANFEERLQQHEFEELKCCWLPEAFVLKETVPAVQLLKGGIDRVKLRHIVTERTEKDLAKAAKFIEKDKKYEGGKILLHALRLNVLGTQLAREGRITDYRAINPLLEEQGIDITSPVALDATMKALLLEARTTFAHATA